MTQKLMMLYRCRHFQHLGLMRSLQLEKLHHHRHPTTDLIQTFHSRRYFLEMVWLLVCFRYRRL